ncbi:O-antigen ligase family protein [Microbacterium radiodurans]|nr:O-antigen ligase family protein [Microbacterium radiodurans]
MSLASRTAARTPASEPPASPDSQPRSLAAKLFLGLLFLRLVADAAFLPGGVQTLTNQAVIFGAIAAGVVLFLRKLNRATLSASGLIFLVVFAWFLVAVGDAGFSQPLLSAALRFSALIGMAALAFTSVRALGGPRFATNLLWVSFPFVLALALGTVSRSPLLFSPGTGRAFGTFNHTNSAASFVAVFVLLCLYLLFRQRRLRYAFALVVGLFAVVGTLSLGGLSALAAGLVVMLVASNLSIGAKLGSLIAALMVGGIVIAGGALDSRLEQLETTVSFDDASSATSTNSLDWRFYNWRRFLALWEERPLFGWGLGRGDYDLQPIGKQPHNEYVRALLETGIVGTTIIALALAMVLVSLLAKKDVDHWGRALAIAALTTLLVNAVASNTTSYAPTMMLAIAVWAAGSDRLQISSSDSIASGSVNPSSKRRAR